MKVTRLRPRPASPSSRASPTNTKRSPRPTQRTSSSVTSSVPTITSPRSTRSAPHSATSPRSPNGSSAAKAQPGTAGASPPGLSCSTEQLDEAGGDDQAVRVDTVWDARDERGGGVGGLIQDLYLVWSDCLDVDHPVQVM